MRKIDCHCHIVNEKIRSDYFSKTDGYAVCMEFIDKFSCVGIENDIYNTVLGDSRLFICPAVDISGDILSQLNKIEKKINIYPVVGLKIYLTYQTGKANDKRLYPVYEFARKHRLSVTFHTGSCSLVLPTDNDMDGSSARFVKDAAADFPDVNFIVAHMDDPRFEECIKTVHEMPNMYTDFSGAYEPGTHEGADIEWAIQTFKNAIELFPDTYKKILYGTDFCPPINLTAIGEYDYTIEKIFSSEQRDDVYFYNCLRAFPKIKDYIERD